MLCNYFLVSRMFEHCGFGRRGFIRSKMYIESVRLYGLRKDSHHIVPKGGVCPRNLLFLGSREENQIPRFARDDKK